MEYKEETEFLPEETLETACLDTSISTNRMKLWDWMQNCSHNIVSVSGVNQKIGTTVQALQICWYLKGRGKSICYISLKEEPWLEAQFKNCLLYTSPSPRDLSTSRMPSSA